MDELRTGRLLLRAFRLDDRADVHAFGSDPDVVRYMNWGPNTEAETQTHIARVAAGATPTRFPYALERLADGHVIGSVELMIDSIGDRRAEMGYVLARQAWGQGYATEAAAVVLAYAFDRLGMHRVFATCDPANPGSGRVLEKLGMTYEGRLRDHYLIRGEWRDRLLYAKVSGRED
jgi:ribosomal-protein-alanine N-acetyltransferase